ncbi:MAG TPA: BON domain-containing protein [Actinomycetota bacterium]|nr:BON domain-containing protein [Actinomycetota bacterium]
MGGGIGALLSYLWDPDRGRARRVRLRDRAAGLGRRVRRRGARRGWKAISDARGLILRLRHRREEIPENDETLVQKVRSEVLGRGDMPSGVTVGAERGVVSLRGQVQHPHDIRTLERAVRRVPGVRGVENLLHLPGVPPRNTEPAHRVGG